MKRCAKCGITGDDYKFFPSQKYNCKMCSKEYNRLRYLKVSKRPKKPGLPKNNIYTPELREFEQTFSYLAKRNWFNNGKEQVYIGTVAVTPEEKISILLRAINHSRRAEYKYWREDNEKALVN